MHVLEFGYYGVAKLPVEHATCFLEGLGCLGSCQSIVLPKKVVFYNSKTHTFDKSPCLETHFLVCISEACRNACDFLFKIDFFDCFWTILALEWLPFGPPWRGKFSLGLPFGHLYMPMCCPDRPKVCPMAPKTAQMASNVA